MKPDDVCGVPGGNGTSCLDACGVANGDGTSCVSTPSPTATFESDFEECGTASSTKGASEKQGVWIYSSDIDPSSSDGFGGTYTLSFAGSTTAPLAVFATAADIELALTSLDSVRDSGVTVTGLLTDDGVSNASAVTGLATQIRFGVEFPASMATTEEVQNVGDLPLLTLNTSTLSGDVSNDVVTEYCAGAYRAGYDYAEQTVTLTSSGGLVTDMTGSFALKLRGSGDCGNGTSLAIAPTSTPLELAKAIAGGVGAGLFGGSLPASRVEAFLTGSSETSRTWTVRLYTLSGEDLTGCSDTGAFAAFEPVLSLGDAQATVSVSVATAGVVPSDAMPVDLTLAVAQEGATEAATVEAAEASSLGYVKPLVVVCGDGAYMTAEGCDDGNRISGDGCDANCTVESGFVCTKPVSWTSVCTLPLDATIQFQNGGASHKVAEGNSTVFVVERIGDNATACDVAYTTVDSTAKHLARQNTEYSGGSVPAAGDYAWMNGTLHFAVGELTKTLTVAAYEDGTYDGVADEVFLLRLTSTTCEGGFVDDAATLESYVHVKDHDLVPSPAPSVPPTNAPTTAAPSAAPTLNPSIDCASGARFRLKGFGNVTWEIRGAGASSALESGALERSENFMDWVCLADACYDVAVTSTDDADTAWRFDDSSGTSAEAAGAKTIRACVLGGLLEGFPTSAPTASPQPSGIPTPAPSTKPSPAASDDGSARVFIAGKPFLLGPRSRRRPRRPRRRSRCPRRCPCRSPRPSRRRRRRPTARRPRSCSATTPTSPRRGPSTTASAAPAPRTRSSRPSREGTATRASRRTATS